MYLLVISFFIEYKGEREKKDEKISKPYWEGNYLIRVTLMSTSNIK